MLDEESGRTSSQVLFETMEEPQRAEAPISKSRRRHNVTNGHKCPICGQVYADIPQHLRVTERVTNKTELALLSKFAHRHFIANLDCPVHLCQSKHITRLDKHLQKIHQLEANQQLGRETYQRVAAFMCHDANTAKRFYQAEDPAEVTFRSRALTTRAISTYAAKKEEEQESSGPDEHVRRRLYQQHRKKVLVLSKQQKTVSFKEDDGMDHHGVECPVLQRGKHMESSSGEDGTDDWKPTQNDSDGDSEESEEEVTRRVSNLPKKKRVKCYVLQRQKQIEYSSEGDGTYEREVKLPILKRWDEKALMSPPRVLPLNTAGVTLDLVTLKAPLDEQALMSPSQVLPLNTASVTLDVATHKTPLMDNVAANVPADDEKALMSPSQILPLNTASVTLDVATHKTPLMDNIAVELPADDEQALVSPSQVLPLNTASVTLDVATHKTPLDEQALMSPSQVLPLNTASVTLDVATHKASLMDNVAVNVPADVQHVCKSPGTAQTTNSINVEVSRCIFHQSYLFQLNIPISGPMGQTVDQEGLSHEGSMEQTRSGGEKQLRDANTQEEPLKKMSEEEKRKSTEAQTQEEASEKRKGRRGETGEEKIQFTDLLGCL